MTPQQKSDIARRLAAEAGFAHAGIAAARPVARSDYVDQWLEAGRAGEMTYLSRHRELRRDPRRLLENARSVIVVADLYQQTIPDDLEADRGRVARYAWGRDYHKVLRKKLHRLADALKREIKEPFDTRVCVDTAPIIEREAAVAAGAGWIGKNTMVLHPRLGSMFFLGEIITTLELAPSEPITDHCGSCTRCLDACPTGALDAPYRMDATRCISYLTIEHRSAIPDELQPHMENWIFGCDICQDVCPFNRKAPPGNEDAYRAGERNALTPVADLHDLLDWDEADYRANLAGSAMKRASLDMLRRNAKIALGNVKRSASERINDP